MGFAVSRQVRGAVSRNRVRRRIREAYRHVRAQLAGDLAVVIVARPNAATRPFPDLLEDMRRLAEALTEASRRDAARP